MNIRIRAWMRCGEWDEQGEKQAFVMVGPDELAFEKYAPLAELLEDKPDEAYYMLSTDWKDDEGNELFQQDIVEYRDENFKFPHRYEIKYSREYAAFVLVNGMSMRLLGNCYGTIKKIGTLYENPDLLDSERKE